MTQHPDDMRDVVDEILDQLSRAWPAFDPCVLAASGRLVRAGRLVDQGFRERMAAFNAEPWEFDVLDALRRAGPPYRLTAGALLRSMMVSSGAMTNRVDRLVAKGVVAREVDPDNRRQVLISLTENGHEVVKRLLPVTEEYHTAALAGLSRSDMEDLASLLRKLLISMGDVPKAPGDAPRTNGSTAPA